MSIQISDRKLYEEVEMYTPACTFTPRSRNRFACNCCVSSRGRPVVLPRKQLEGHRNAVFNQNNPRSRAVPPLRFKEKSVQEPPTSPISYANESGTSAVVLTQKID